MHCKCGSVCVKAGDVVKKGQKIAELGNSGYSRFPHLHFAVQVNGSGSFNLWSRPHTFELSVADTCCIGGDAAKGFTAVPHGRVWRIGDLIRLSPE
jgi:murein DD-endopeptidase MepM/ murein hydrolase activator NlpD